MRFVFLLLGMSVLAFGDVEVSGHVSLDSQSFLNAPDSKNKSSFSLKKHLELSYAHKDFTLYSKLFAQKDYHDFLTKKERTDRTFIRVDELFMKYDFEDDSILFGRTIKFWGALELSNIVDVFNPIDLRSDMLEPDKMGVLNASYSHFSENGEFSIVVKFEELNQEMAASPYVYNLLESFMSYDSHLNTSEGVNHPSLYISYNASTESEYALDYAFILQRGYDSQRYFSSSVLNPYKLVQNGYIVNKFMTYNTLVIDATLIKLEALYADVVDDENVGDYSHIALGFEHTIENIYKSAELGIIAEYYRYDRYEKQKKDDLELYITMQNDIFLGARYSFNDSDDSSIVGGVVHDNDYDEQTYYAQYESRFGENFKLELDYYYIEPSKNTQTAYAALGRHQRVGLTIAYYF